MKWSVKWRHKRRHFIELKVCLFLFSSLKQTHPRETKQNSKYKSEQGKKNQFIQRGYQGADIHPPSLHLVPAMSAFHHSVHTYSSHQLYGGIQSRQLVFGLRGGRQLEGTCENMQTPHRKVVTSLGNATLSLWGETLLAHRRACSTHC